MGRWKEVGYLGTVRVEYITAWGGGVAGENEGRLRGKGKVRMRTSHTYPRSSGYIMEPNKERLKICIRNN